MRAIDFSAFSAFPLVVVLFRPLARRSVRNLGLVGLVGAAASSLGGCAQQPAYQRTAHSKEYFPASIYGRPSPRVVADGEPVPRGGGIYLVGKPYSVAGRVFYPSEKQRPTIGLASWYGTAFHGRRTANGEVYDCEAISAAHPTMPLPSYARVTNLDNRHSLIVRVNDRGPFHANRVLDVSRRAAQVLDFHGSGTTRVKVEYVGPAGLAGSDDSKLLATLRLDGPAALEGRDRETSTEVASSMPSRSASREPAEPSPVEISEINGRSVRMTEAADARDGVNGKSLSLAAAVPLPPARPFEVGARSPASRSSSTQIARASSERPAAGH